MGSNKRRESNGINFSGKKAECLFFGRLLDKRKQSRRFYCGSKCGLVHFPLWAQITYSTFWSLPVKYTKRDFFLPRSTYPPILPLHCTSPISLQIQLFLPFPFSSQANYAVLSRVCLLYPDPPGIIQRVEEKRGATIIASRRWLLYSKIASPSRHLG